MRNEHRLRRAEMRERGHEGVAGRRCLRGERVDDGGDGPLQQWNAAAQVQPQIQRDLFVARPSGVQAPPSVAEPLDQLAFDEAVHVLVVARDEGGVRSCLVEQRHQRLLDPARFVGVQHAGASQRARPRDAPGDVVFEQAAVDAEGGAEFEGRGIGRSIEAA